MRRDQLGQVGKLRPCRSAQVRSGQIRAVSSNQTGQFTSGQVGLVRPVSSDKIDHLRSFFVRSGLIRLVRSSQVRSDRSGQVRLGQLGYVRSFKSVQVRSAQVSGPVRSVSFGQVGQSGQSSWSD